MASLGYHELTYCNLNIHISTLKRLVDQNWSGASSRCYVTEGLILCFCYWCLFSVIVIWRVILNTLHIPCSTYNKVMLCYVTWRLVKHNIFKRFCNGDELSLRGRGADLIDAVEFNHILQWSLQLLPFTSLFLKCIIMEFVNNIQSSTVITESNIVRYYINNYRNWGRISIRCWIHKRHTSP